MYECPMCPYWTIASMYKYEYAKARADAGPAIEGQDVMINGHGCII